MPSGNGGSDVLTPEQRRRCMSAIRGRDTKPELRLRNALWALGHRYRIGHGLPGRPDLVFVSRKIAVFVDGCFWHHCPEHFRMPQTNQEFWERKIARNVARDETVNAELATRGWKVIRLWEHELRRDSDVVVRRLHSILSTGYAESS